MTQRRKGRRGSQRKTNPVVHDLASHEDTKGTKLKMASFVIFVALCEFREVLKSVYLLCVFSASQRLCVKK